MEIYRKIENLFEKICAVGFRLFSNSIVFIAALALTIVWFAVHDWHSMTFTDTVRDVILAITFLSFFMIQKTFSHFSQALHLKLNELIAAQDKARNHVIKAEEKSVEEIKELAKEHDRIVGEIIEEPKILGE